MKKNKIFHILSAAVLLALASSCNLDTTSYSSVSDNTIEEAENYLSFANGSYRLLKNDGGVIENSYRFATYGGDELSVSGSTTDPLMNYFLYRRTATSSRDEYAWELGYRTIGNTNKAIELYDAMPAPSTEETILCGEQYYLRGLSYFLLVNMFSQPYINNPTQNLGLPIKLVSNPNSYPDGRSTVAETYEQIEKDLLKSIELMTIPSGGPNPKKANYASKEAAQALLARVYLYMERFDDAYNYANIVINSGRYSLLQGEDYTKYPQFVPEENSETIFAVRRTKDKDDAGSGQIGSMYINIDATGWEEIYASSRYLDLLELHPEDLRNKFIVKKNPKNDQLRFVYSKVRSNSLAYQYGKISVVAENGGYKITSTDADSYKDQKVKKENHYLGSRYYVETTTGQKYYGRVEPTIDERNDYPKYTINKCSYQEQTKQLWSPIVSRLAEMYLIRAEVSAHKGNTQQALDDVNVIRSRAGISVYKVSDLTTAHSIAAVIAEERMLELAFEGHRRYDVFRNRQFMNLSYPGFQLNSDSKRNEIPYDDPSVCSLIPQRELNNYPGSLVQNPI